jgi:hypothetical protein
LVATRLGAFPLSTIERQVLEETLFEAGKRPDVEFDYRTVQRGDNWQLRFTPDLGAYGLASDGRLETLQKIAEEHRRLVRQIRAWDDWRQVRRPE